WRLTTIKNAWTPLKRHPGEASICSKAGFNSRYNRIGRDAEMLVKVRRWCAGAETAHPNKDAVGADEAVPALSDAGFNRHANRRVAEHRIAIVFRLHLKQLKARNRDHAGRDAALFKHLLCLNRDLNL